MFVCSFGPLFVLTEFQAIQCFDVKSFTERYFSVVVHGSDGLDGSTGAGSQGLGSAHSGSGNNSSSPVHQQQQQPPTPPRLSTTPNETQSNSSPASQKT